MGLFNKKEDVPEIPTAPSLPDLPKIPREEAKKELPELPSFPTTPKNENFNQEMVKTAVADSSPPEEKESEVSIPEIPTVPESKRESESSLFSPPKLEFPTPSIQKEEISITPQLVQTPITRDSDPIFVRIDKFQDSQKNFNSVKQKVGEIESVLRKIKEVKMKEESELKAWTDDVEKIKTKLAEIDADIFSQI